MVRKKTQRKKAIRKKAPSGKAKSAAARLTQADVESAVETILSWTDGAPGRDGLAKTPARVARSLKQLTDGGGTTLEEIMTDAVFEETSSGLVLIRDVEFYSLCEHHLLPFFGRCHVAYLPKKHLIGFSRVPRLVDHFARSLQVQERFTSQVATALHRAVKPQGVACVAEGFHLCMAMRGVKKQQAVAVTTAYTGVFKSRPEERGRLGDLLRGSSRFSPDVLEPGPEES